MSLILVGTAELRHQAAPAVQVLAAAPQHTTGMAAKVGVLHPNPVSGSQQTVAQAATKGGLTATITFAQVEVAAGAVSIFPVLAGLVCQMNLPLVVVALEAAATELPADFRMAGMVVFSVAAAVALVPPGMTEGMEVPGLSGSCGVSAAITQTILVMCDAGSHPASAGAVPQRHGLAVKRALA